MLGKAHVGDCKNLPLDDKSVHLFVTSPPYNVGIDYGNGFKDDVEYDNYMRGFIVPMIDEMYRCLVDGGRACINVAGTDRKPYRDTPAEVSYWARACGFLLRGTVIWNKGPGIARKSTAWGSYLSTTNPILRDRWEAIIMLSKGTYTLDHRGLGEDDMTPSEFGDYSDSVWDIPPVTVSWHPAPFPMELAERCIKWLTPRGAIVCDPCCGSGTTLYAAKHLYRNFVGFDQNKEFVARVNENLGNNMFDAMGW